MPDTLNDLTATSSDWLDVYTLTGITVGNAVSINNKGGYQILIQEKPTKPDASDKNGKLLSTSRIGGFNAIITSGSTGIWIKALRGSCDVNVQEI